MLQLKRKSFRKAKAIAVTHEQKTMAVSPHKHEELAADKTYLTVPELSEKLEADESEIMSAIRFGALDVQRFPVRGAKKFRIEESIAKAFAKRFYARLI